MPSPGNEFVDVTYADALARIAARWPDREALVCAGKRFTFAEVKRKVDAASARLATLVLEAGDKIAIWLPNRPEFLWFWLGASQMGLVPVILNTRLTMAECAYQIAQSDSRAILLPGEGAFRDFLGDLVAHFPRIGREGPPALRHVICCDRFARALDGVLDWSEPPSAPPPLPSMARDPGAVALISYSSGTTALPKGAMITHCVWRKAYDIGERIDVTCEDRLYLAIPLFGSMAMMNGVLPFWTRGAAVVVAERFEAERCVEDCLAERCTIIHLLPPMIDALTPLAKAGVFAGHRLRVAMCLTNDSDKLASVAEVLGIPGVITGYGMTETTTVLTRNRWDDPLEVRCATQGYPLPDVEIRIADPESGDALPQGHAGEIRARGYCVMAGYYNKPEETKAAITPDGWFRTGDLGVIDATGRLAFQGRLGDGYKSRGFNVSPAEVEAALLLHPAVDAAAVVGVPHESHGAVGAAFVVLSAPVAPEALRAFLRERLASFKLPEHLFPIDALPMTAGTGKVQKFKLKAEALARLALAPDAVPSFAKT